MPNRRQPSFSSYGYGPQPPSPMTPSGGSGQIYDDSEPLPFPTETPAQFRRRTTPVDGPPQSPPTAIQDLIALIMNGR